MIQIMIVLKLVKDLFVTDWRCFKFLFVVHFLCWWKNYILFIVSELAMSYWTI